METKHNPRKLCDYKTSLQNELIKRIEDKMIQDLKKLNELSR